MFLTLVSPKVHEAGLGYNLWSNEDKTGFNIPMNVWHISNALIKYRLS